MRDCLCGFKSPLAPDTAEFHRQHKAKHLAVFPGCADDGTTVATFDRLIASFEKYENRKVG
jgi:hypothetical protein